MHLQSKTSSTGDTVAQGDSVCICILFSCTVWLPGFSSVKYSTTNLYASQLCLMKECRAMLMPLPTQCKHSSRVTGNKANEPERNQTDKLQATWPKQDSWQISKKVLPCKQGNTDLSNILRNSDITCFYFHVMSECNMKKILWMQNWKREMVQLKEKTKLPTVLNTDVIWFVSFSTTISALRVMGAKVGYNLDK